MDNRTTAQIWADRVTTFSGSWPFIWVFVVFCVAWIGLNVGEHSWDPYPFLFLNWTLTVVSSLQSPLIMLSQNRQNETDRENIESIKAELKEIKTLLEKLNQK